MFGLDPIGLAFAGAAVILFFAFQWLRENVRSPAQRAAEREARRKFEEWRAANPPGPPLTPEERRAFEDWVADETLPAIVLTPGNAPIVAGGTRIGGPAWLAEGEEWPRDREGRTMEFIAQIDFGDLPAIPDFPDSGLLQFFIGQNDFFGADFDNPDACDIRLIWRPEPVTGRLVAPPPFDDETDMTPLLDPARTSGMSLSGTAGAMPPTIADWRVDAKIGNREGADELYEALEARGTAFDRVHQIGGHPVYTQFDFRSAERFGDYDRTLLRLTSDASLMWGDMGEAAFTIRREDLIARRFDRAIFWWDCT